MADERSQGTESDVQAVIRRQLQTDRLLGARYLPLRPPLPRASAPRPPAERRSVATAPASAATAAPTASGKRPDVLQALPAEELEQREAHLRELDESKVKVCRKCGLCETRTKTVFGQGHAGARLVFVGEAPGRDEDQQGLAFVGRAGQLLTKMIEAMGLTRDEVFICNILKCRPPNNRDPAPDEVSSCWPYLDEQLRTIRPEVIVTLGKPAVQTLLRTNEAIGRLRGVWHEYYTSGTPMVGEPTPLMPTYHPAYLLRNPNDKGKAWSDLKMVMAKLGLPIPSP